MANGCKREDIDNRVDQSDAGQPDELPSADGSGANYVGLTERLAQAFAEDSDGDLLLQQNNREDTVLQWLQALDFQVIGACRADERIKPLLKLSASSGVAEDRLLAHLSQHFEPAEVGMLARCFCMPLVSIRVGKIDKQGTLLCPTPTRGNLNLTLLPTSDMRLSFVCDDGHMERIVTLSNNNEHSSVTIEEIVQDTSGRSFHIKTPDGRVFFFWCSEKSKLLGVDLLGKMKDLLERRPSIAELTGIDESRLECFATYLRAYLVGSAMCNTHASVSSCTTISTVSKLGSMSKNGSSSSASASKYQQLRSGSSQVSKANSLYQASLSPRISSFKESTPRSFLCSRSSMTREKLKKRVENPLTAVENLSIASQVPAGTSNAKSGDVVKLEESNVNPFSLGFLESLGKLAISTSISTVSEGPFAAQPIFSPYYCWCPPDVSTSHQSLSTPDLLSPSNDSTLQPPLQLATSAQSINLADLPPFDFPAFLPDPLVCLPKPTSQQIPTFTPLICDPIVHVPVIDVCSAGQGYLVSAGPAVSTTISPLRPKLVSPLIPETDPVVEEGARETLRLLLSGSGPSNPPLVGVLPFPAVLANEKPSSAFIAGSRGLYCGPGDVDAIISSSFAAIGLISLPERNQCSESITCSGDDCVNKDEDAANPCNESERST